MAQGLIYNPSWDPKQSRYPGAPYGFGAGNPFPVGSAPGGSGGWGAFGTPPGGGWGSGGGPSFGDTKAAFDQTVGDVRGQLGGSADLSRFGALGGAAMQGVLNPQGFGDDVLRRQMTRLAEREAGLRESGLRGLSNRAGATGFGQSASALDVGANMRGQSAGRLGDAELNLLMQDAQLKRSSQADMLRAALGLTGEERGYRSQLADFFANVQRPLGGGGAGGGQQFAGTGGKMPKLNEQGRPTGTYEDGTPLDDFGWQQAWKMRQAWEQTGGQFGG